MKINKIKSVIVLFGSLFLILSTPMISFSVEVVVVPLSSSKGKTYWNGTWVTNTEYRAGDVIYVNGKNYECVSTHTSTPDITHLNTTYWTLVAGNSNTVDTSTGNATAGDLASGKKAWVDGQEITGTYVCPSGQSYCGGQCVDVLNNPAFCGDCNTACDPGVLCNSGQCHGIPGAACTDHGDCNSGKCSLAGTCLDTSKFVFLSSSNYNGNFGGIGGAHTTCQNLADAAGLPGHYKAWLSSSSHSPKSYFVQSKLPYVNVNGVTVAADWDALLRTELAVPLNLDENGETRLVRVWTSTSALGVAADTNTQYTCNDWSSTVTNAYVGDNQKNDQEWTSLGLFESCAVNRALYCFEQ